MTPMRTTIEYIYGKHAVYEVLHERPDVVSEVHAAADFSDARIIELVKARGIKLKLLNLNALACLKSIRRQRSR